MEKYKIMMKYSCVVFIIALGKINFQKYVRNSNKKNF